MITSVTSATVAATSAAAGFGVALGAGGALFVIGLLVALELIGPADRGWQIALQRGLRIATGPLVVVFVVSVAAKALAILAS
ncbi:MAG: hypothetical protein ACYDAK_14030 [Candidatus Limnocylindrales bacterium]